MGRPAQEMLFSVVTDALAKASMLAAPAVALGGWGIVTNPNLTKTQFDESLTKSLTN